MTVYPSDIDDDATILRISDNISELGEQAINQLRDAVFAIESTLGINPQGSAGTVVNRLDQSLDASGNIKASALASIGLITLPITDSQVATNAAIQESKLALDFGTSSLRSLIVANTATLNSLSAFATATNADLLIHIGGGTVLTDGSTLGRHVASHIDLNSIPNDGRDTLFTWGGLLDKDGVQRTATNVASALEQINNDFVDHQNATADAHVATAISVDTGSFVEIPSDADTVQKALDAIDDAETLNIGIHRATMHANGVPHAARSNVKNLDGYSQNIVPSTEVKTFLVRPPATVPKDNNTTGDDLVQFLPDNTGFVFDSYFTQVRPGDIITINYGNGVVSKYPVESFRFVPNTEWFVRLNGVNLFNTPDGYDGYSYARIDRPLFDPSTQGVLAAASANNDIDTDITGSIIVGHPRGASVVGLGFDANKLNSTHYNLYLELYPTGNPVDKVIVMPAIDVTANAGVTPGQYTIDRVVQNINNGFRAGGYNYRFIAFNHKGELGIMLADVINNASFAIISGEISGATIVEGSFVNNVIGDAVDGQDAFGFGANAIALAGPSFVSAYSSSQAAVDFPVKVHVPLKNRNYIANGVRRDAFADTYLANADGYWPATITERNPVSSTTVEVTYTVEMRLEAAELMIGKTIVVQPDIDFDDALYSDVDYGRFIIKSVSFTDACDSPPSPASTIITVINGRHATGFAFGVSAATDLPVRLYFSEDSVGFNAINMVDTAVGSITYNRFHEIYISDAGKTFSHERARLPKNNESPDLLATTNRWTIKDVSPKLRGFRDTSSSDVRRYVRFYVLSFDSSTGEFDGYIGRRTGDGIPGITDTGIVVTSRKNIPAKFYDSSNIDYIELEYFDETSSPGTNILSTNFPRYVDIEIFPTLRYDEELMLVASCELDNKEVQCVQDRREIGNISEDNFSDSAIKFITSGDRFLHENGILRGLSVDGIDPADSSLININGGIALVNGHIVAVNSASVKIPEIRFVSDSLPATVEWAVCVNEHGQYVPIVLTSAKDQFFATPDGASNYYIPSVDFTELITSRKDLTLITVVTATISSIALSTTDARKFVNGGATDLPFTLVADDNKFIGNFTSLDQVHAWIDRLGVDVVKVIMRGEFIIDTTPLDLRRSEAETKVIYEGDGAKINVRMDNGVLIRSNVTIRNIVFSYRPSINVTEVINPENACILASGQNAYGFVTIEDCEFTYADGEVGADKKPPLISFLITGSGISVISGITIRNNTFNAFDSLNARAGVAFVYQGSGGVTPSIFINILIENNTMAKNLGIFMVGPASRPGATMSDCRIVGNTCSMIGFANSGVDAGGLLTTNLGLEISGNNCHMIAHVDTAGVALPTSSSTYGTGKIIITNNFVNTINVIANSVSTTDIGSVVVSNNQLVPMESDIESYATSNFGLANFYAINVRSNTSISNAFATATITNNIIDSIIIEGTEIFYSVSGVLFDCSAIVSGNIITGVDGLSAFCIANTASSSYVRQVNITGNQIHRRTQVAAFILGPGSTNTSIEGTVVDNVFNSHTIDGGSDTNVIKNAPPGWFIARNKNQTVTKKITTNLGIFSIFSLNLTIHSALASADFIMGDPDGYMDQALIGRDAASYDTALFEYLATSGSQTFNWSVALDSIVPVEARVVQIGATGISNKVAATSGSLNVRILKHDNTIIVPTDVVGSFTGSYTPGTEFDVTATASGTLPKSGVDGYFINVQSTINNNTSLELQVKDVFVTYRY